MLAVDAASFLKEFTIYCNKASDERETIVITRSNGKNAVLLSLEEYNEMKKQLYRQTNEDL